MNTVTNFAEELVAIAGKSELVFVEDTSLEFVGGGTVTNIL